MVPVQVSAVEVEEGDLVVIPYYDGVDDYTGVAGPPVHLDGEVLVPVYMPDGTCPTLAALDYTALWVLFPQAWHEDGSPCNCRELETRYAEGPLREDDTF